MFRYKGNTILRWIRYILEYIIAIIVLTFVKIIGIKAASYACGWIFSLIAPTLFKINGRDKTALEVLKMVDPNLTEKEAKKIRSQCYKNWGKSAGEFTAQNGIDEKWLDENVTVHGIENLLKIVNRTCGMIGVTAHIGNWEIIHQYLKIKYGVQIYVVFRNVDNPFLARLLMQIRSNTQNIEKRNTSDFRSLVKIMQSGNLVGVLLDQRSRKGNDTVNFFGRKARISVPLLKSAIRNGYNIIPVCCIRDEQTPHKFHLFAEDVIVPPSEYESLEDETVTLAQRVFDAYEKWIKAYPSQWMLVYNIWR